ncbi:MAG: FG-GAP-like repeat-containing protein [Pyrinomonadaceae bacterium]
MKKRISVFITLFVLVSVTMGGTVRLDTAFNGTGYQLQQFSSDGAWGFSVAVQADGKVVVGGTQLVGGNIGDFAAMRLLTAGNLDNTFDLDGRVATNLGPFDQSTSMLIQADGKIVLGGSRYSGTTNNDFAAARYNLDGTLDSSFDLNGVVATNNNAFSNDFSEGMAIQSDGKLVLVGTTAFATDPSDNNQTDIMIIRYNVDGSLDSTFAGSGKLIVAFPNFSESAKVITIQPNGKILIGGYLYNGQNDDFLMMRFMPNGMLDDTFGTGGLVTILSNGSDMITSLALQPDGKILAGGFKAGISVLLRYNSNGSPDSTFGGSGSVNAGQSVYKIILDSTGKILIGGSQFSRFAISRFETNGSVDATFNQGTAAAANIPNHQCSGFSMALQNDGKILVSGTCSNGFGLSKMSVARFAEFPLKSRTDFDGDGKSDLSVYRPSEGNWYVLRSTAGISITSWGLASDIVAPGDFDGDGKTDFSVFRPSEGSWYIANSNGTFTSGQFGLPGDIPVPADYDGDGKDDRAVFRPSNSTWYILNSNGLNVRTQAFGLSGDRPVPGDYDGDLKADLSVFRPSNGTWYRANSGNGNFVEQQWGLNGDIPVNADYDGDNKQDFAVFRPSSAQWYILNSSNPSYNFRSFGLTGDVPVPGDYDGNGSDDIAVFRNGFWYIIRSAQVYTTTQFGLSGDRAIPAK